MSDFDLIRAFGYPVIEVPDLKDQACLVDSQDVVLVRAGISKADRDWVIDSLLARIAATPLNQGEEVN